MIKAKAKTKTHLSLASMPQLSRKTKIKKTLLILSAIIISKKAIIPINILRRSQKTSIGFGGFYVDK